MLYAQFWNEDGHVFFADAYNFGWWAALFSAYAGYLHVFPRLGAALALLVPLSFAPLVMNLVAIGAQALPASLLLSSCSTAWGSLRFRAFLASIYLALPNCYELSSTISNSYWPLALSAFLLLAASAPRGVRGRLFDFSIISLSGLTGPFCIFLLPIAVFLAWRKRDRWHWVVAGVLAAACFIQMWSLWSGGFSSRPHYAHGASPELFARILAGQVYLGTLLGGNGLAAHAGLGFSIVLTGIAAAGTILIAFCFLRSPLVMKLFLLFSIMILLSALISPTLGLLSGVSAWEVLARGGGARYWFLPTLAFAWSILFCSQSRFAPLKAVSAFLLCLMCFGIIRDWRHPAFPDAHFTEYVRRFESVAPGTAFTIPESTQGWNLTLVKRP